MIFLLILALAGLGSLQVTGAASGFAVSQASTLAPISPTVTNLQDSGPGSLRAAVAMADGVARGELVRIGFAVGLRGQITLASPIAVGPSYNVSIGGPGAGALRISGNDATRLFDVAPAATLALADLTLTHGRVIGPSPGPRLPGGPGEGGAIFNRGIVSLRQVNVTDNAAIGGLSPLSHGGPAYGGAILNKGILEISRCLFSGNVALGSDDHRGAGEINYEMTGGSAAGGAIRNEGLVQVGESEFRDNAAIGGEGIGVPVPLSTLRVATEGGDALGGAIFNGKGSSGFEVENSTFANNAARGGSVGLASIIKVSGSDAAGGAVYSLSGAVKLRQSTVVDNKAVPGRQSAEKPGRLGAGGLDLGAGGSLHSDTIIFNLGSADVDSGTAAKVENSIVGSCAGAGLDSAGFNLAYRDSCKLGAATDLNNVDARLGSLGDEGGPTRTMPLTAASPAVDAGSSDLKTDQRGNARPVRFSNRALPPAGNAADIGAFELQRVPELRWDLSPQRLDFGVVPTGTVSKLREVTLVNEGDLTFAVGAVTIGGESEDEFSISSQTCKGIDLAAGASCRVRVRFSPEEEGSRGAKLTIEAKVPTGPLAVPLAGNGLGSGRSAAR